MGISFWTVIISIIIGVVSNLITTYAPKIVGKISASVKQANEKKKQVFDKTIQYILDNPQEEIILRIRFASMSIVALMVMLASLFLMLSSNLLVILGGFIFSLMAYYTMIKSIRLGRIITEVAKRKDKERPGVNLN